MEISDEFLVSELQSNERKAPKRGLWGGGNPQDHPTPGVGYTQGHDREWSCGHGRYIPVSVTRLLCSQVPGFSKDPHGGRYLKRL